MAQLARQRGKTKFKYEPKIAEEVNTGYKEAFPYSIYADSDLPLLAITSLIELNKKIKEFENFIELLRERKANPILIEKYEENLELMIEEFDRRIK
jgi:hypothetical protein